MYKLFKSWSEWASFMLESLKGFGLGILHILWGIVNGIASLAVALWDLMVGFTSKYPKLMLMLSATLMFLIWLGTFVSLRTTAVAAEDQRDSISYQYGLLLDQMETVQHVASNDTTGQ